MDDHAEGCESQFQCGGIVVNPGDIITGHMNGVVVVPREIAAELLRRRVERKDVEAAYLAAVKRGEFSNEWVNKILTEGKCEICEDGQYVEP